MEGEHRQDARQHLQAAVERWYRWLVSHPPVLFHPEDAKRMQIPVVHFFQTNEGLTQSALKMTEWFISKGAQTLVNRLQKGDYDAYDQRPT